MRNLILNNLLAKIVSILLAIALWFLIKKNIETTTAPARKAEVAARKSAR